MHTHRAIPNATNSTGKHEKKYLLKPLARLEADDEVSLGDGEAYHRQAHNFKEHVGCIGSQEGEGEVTDTGGGCTVSVGGKKDGGKRFAVENRLHICRATLLLSKRGTCCLMPI